MNEAVAALFGAFIGAATGGVVDVLLLRAQRRSDARWRLYTELLPLVTVFPNDSVRTIGLFGQGDRREKERGILLIPRVGAGAGRRVRRQAQRYFDAFEHWYDETSDQDAFRRFCQEAERLEKLLR